MKLINGCIIIQVNNPLIKKSNFSGNNRDKPLISIILPSLNEKEAIKKVITEINRVNLPKKEILVIDGCSTDGTINVAKNLGAKVIIEPKRGYGNAILKGINIAKGQIIVIMDLDYTYPGYYIPQLVTPLLKNEADLVLGNRIRKINFNSMKILHIFGNKILTKIFNFLFHSKIRDTQTGFRTFRKNTFKKMKIKSQGIFLPTEILIQALKLRLKIEEKSIIYRPRIGQSKLSPIRDGLVILVKMIIVRFLKFFHQKSN